MNNTALRSLIREILDEEITKIKEDEELEETSSSGAAGAYMTPAAFVGPKGRKPPKKGVNSGDFKPVKFGESIKLSELSPKTMGSYVKKSSADVAKKAADSAGTAQYDYGGTNDRDTGKESKRLKGISTATDKLTKKAENK